MSHLPVMLQEAIAALDPKPGQRLVDCTFGAGGYSRAILQHEGVQLLSLDRDPDAIPAMQALKAEYPDRFHFAHTAFSGLEAALAEIGWDTVDGIVLDVGVSSMQLDQGDRGFSFRLDGPLDMRMAQAGPSAADLVNTMDMQELARMFRVLGEEKQATRAARAIVAEREKQPFETTGQLASLMEKVLGAAAAGKRIHPATKVFQALRIYVNDELGELARLLSVAERMLAEGGRLVVVAFHSLEDRIVKTYFRQCSQAPSRGSRFLPDTATDFRPSFMLGSRKAIAPGAVETAANPRARSAKLRFAIRTGNPALNVQAEPAMWGAGA